MIACVCLSAEQRLRLPLGLRSERITATSSYQSQVRRCLSGNQPAPCNVDSHVPAYVLHEHGTTEADTIVVESAVVAEAVVVAVVVVVVVAGNGADSSSSSS